LEACIFILEIRRFNQEPVRLILETCGPILKLSRFTLGALGLT
jgi:hypothetical protein